MDLLFTHFGISGPAALRCSSFVNKELENGRTSDTFSGLFPYKTKQELIHILTEKVKQPKELGQCLAWYIA